MVEDFDSFIFQLKSILDLEIDVIENIYRKSRPRENVDISSHQRSGSIRQFEKELQQKTVNLLNFKLKDVLNDYGYI